jgi:hypothetical protein
MSTDYDYLKQFAYVLSGTDSRVQLDRVFIKAVTTLSSIYNISRERILRNEQEDN